ncbi:hypothetical protein BHE74_00000688 [Ensete ventricosum]|nr:hypothetical protein GW17_00001929 [Ensete ventricosum]RWW90176.1 hypothetical protein BHE74_00000688 [Ensete ventricosum]RZR77117.1 hypothetical protein BHM03_00002106 [Ensete ventricosum]
MIRIRIQFGSVTYRASPTHQPPHLTFPATSFGTPLKRSSFDFIGTGLWVRRDLSKLRECPLRSNLPASSPAKVQHHRHDILSKRLRSLLCRFDRSLFLDSFVLVFGLSAAVAWGPGQPLVLEEVEVDPPKVSEIRVKVACTSLCRSDLTQWQSQVGKSTRSSWCVSSEHGSCSCLCRLQAQPDLFPRIFGHEASGVGEGVTEFKEGDHVLTVFIGECQSCKHCTSGKSNMCQKLGLERRGVMHSDQKTRFRVKGTPVYHYCAVSSFSEYTVVHSGCAVKISPSVRMDRACLLSCGVAAGKLRHPVLFLLVASFASVIFSFSHLI